ncbi:MAG: transglycosylase domain-containing protein [Leptospiraceae bacterium]|nr:transglycosylase domain-containing protein [Leptospiraceae bacterium]MDW7976011.1 transglycosylase domain-containing protein [Leptospiraceae bacterium]
MKKKYLYTCRSCNHKQVIEVDLQEIRFLRIVCGNCGNVRILHNHQFKDNPNVATKIEKVSSNNSQSYGTSNKNLIVSKIKSPKKRYHFFENLINILHFVLDIVWSKKTLVLFFLGIFFVSIGIVFISGSMLFFSVDDYLLQIHESQSNVIYDRNGKVLSELFTIKTSTLKWHEVPKDFIEILLFVEDEDFFYHVGIDFSALFRAMYHNLISMRFVQGGSTITQQLARILLGEREKTVTRKLKEAFFALELERRFTKEEILLLYINQVYLGHGAYGFQNASRFYFQKDLENLNFTEKLALASLPSRPEFYSPLRNFQQLEEKMDTIFQRMRKEKFPYAISEEQYRAQKLTLRKILNRSPMETVFGTRDDHAPYVSEWVRTKIKSLLGEKYEFSGGLKVYTTIDGNLQIIVSRETKSHIEELRKYHPYKVSEDDVNTYLLKYYLQSALGGMFLGLPIPTIPQKELQAALIGMNPRTGEILFMQGGAEFSASNQFNRAIFMKRQTGSAIKPIVYSAGIEDGIFHPGTVFEDSPLYFSLNQIQNEYWLPENIDESYEGKITLREALERSRNIPALIAGQRIGIERLGVQFEKFFFHTESEFQKRFRRELAISIGIIEMSPLEMMLAYSAFANNGVIPRPYLITRIEDKNGNVIYQGKEKDEFNTNMPAEKKVLSGDVAEVMISLLKTSAKKSGVNRGGFTSRRLAGKTGTTNQYRDAWFIGVLPDLVSAIWVGFDEPKVSMNKGTGATMAGPLFGKIIKNVKDRYDQGDYFFDPRAVEVSICSNSGKLPNPYCQRVLKEIFPINGVPAESCDMHKPEEELKMPTRLRDFD